MFFVEWRHNRPPTFWYASFRVKSLWTMEKNFHMQENAMNERTTYSLRKRAFHFHCYMSTVNANANTAMQCHASSTFDATWFHNNNTLVQWTCFSAENQILWRCLLDISTMYDMQRHALGFFAILSMRSAINTLANQWRHFNEKDFSRSKTTKRKNVDRHVYDGYRNRCLLYDVHACSACDCPRYTFLKNVYSSSVICYVSDAVYI